MVLRISSVFVYFIRLIFSLIHFIPDGFIYSLFCLFICSLFLLFFSLLVYFIHYLRNDVTTFSTEFHIFYKIFVFFYLLKTNSLFLILLLALICYSYTFYNKNNYFIIAFFIYFLFGFIL